MDFKKDLGIIHVEGGSVKTAGKGNLSGAENVPQNIRTKTDPKQIAKGAAKAAVLAGLFVLRHKMKKRRK